MKLLTLPAIALMFFTAGVLAAPAHTYTITPDEWAQPRNGANMAAMAPVRAAVQEWMKHPGGHIVIMHSGDEIGSLWASEVHDWLVSLGVPSASLQDRISGQDENSVTLSVEP